MAAAGDGREAARRDARVPAIWQVLILVVGLLVPAHDANRWWQRANMYPGQGDYGVTNTTCDLRGFCRIDALTPGGAAALAGVRKGDYVRPDRGMDFSGRLLRAGETIGFTLRHNGALSHLTLTARPRPEARTDRAMAAASPFAYVPWIMTCLIGMFVTLRSRCNASPLLFGAAVICLGVSGIFPTLTESDPLLFPAAILSVIAVYQASPVLFFLFALAARGQTSGKASWAWRAIFLAYAVAQALVGGYFILGYLTTWAIPTEDVSERAYLIGGVLQGLGFLLAFVALAVTWRESRGQERRRYAYMLASGALLALSVKVAATVNNVIGTAWVLSNPLAVLHVVGSIVGAVVFAYAVLRHRVMDIGFAINRTVIYGVVSAILLAAFGLIEWAVDHFVPIQGRENNALVDAAIAVVVFLTFHRVRDIVEHVIERLFFRRWQKAEAVLRRFVKEAAFATRADTLTRGFASALGDYAEGAVAAIYLLGEDGGYRRAAGRLEGVADALDPDDPALLTIRAEPKALVPDQSGSSLKAALAVPMVNRNEVIGVALLGPKHSDLDYRPDEIELISWATRQVGLDLHALKVEKLEAKVGALEAETHSRGQQLALLNEKFDLLLTGRQPA